MRYNNILHLYKNVLNLINDEVKIIEIGLTTTLDKIVVDLLTNNIINVFINWVAVSNYMIDYVTTIEKIKKQLKMYQSVDETFDNINSA